jgi:hypothetical protein
MQQECSHAGGRKTAARFGQARPVPGRPSHGEAEMNGSQTRWE